MADLLQVLVGCRDKLRVFGNGYDTTDSTGIRDYTHVMDVAKGHSSTLEHILSPGCMGAKVFNLGTGGGHSHGGAHGIREGKGKKHPPNLKHPDGTFKLMSITSSALNM